MNFIQRLKAMPPIVLTAFLLTGTAGAIWVMNDFTMSANVVAEGGIVPAAVSMCELDINLAGDELIYEDLLSCRFDSQIGTWTISGNAEFVSTNESCTLDAEDITISIKNQYMLDWEIMNGETLTFDSDSEENSALYVKLDLHESHCPLSGSFGAVLSPPA